MTDVDQDLIDRCMARWRVGKDTADIARMLRVPEHVVERAVHAGLQQAMPPHEREGRSDG